MNTLTKTKRCGKCGIHKLRKLFNKQRKNPDGLDGWCRECKNRAKRQWAQRNPDKVKAYGIKWRTENPEKSRALKKLYRMRHPERVREQVRNAHAKNWKFYRRGNWAKLLRERHGITEADYDALLKKQNNHCAICGNGQKCARRERLYVDHCHETRRIRGLLCFKCNTLLGMAQDKVDILRRAIAYLAE